MRNFCDRPASKRKAEKLENELEKRVWAAFKMLGFRVKELGHRRPGHRLPDGIALPYPAPSYAFMLDAKLTDEYTIGTDDRAYAEYLDRFWKSLSEQKCESLSLIIISCAFRGQYMKQIQELRTKLQGNAGVRSILLLSVDDLIYLVEMRLKYPELSSNFFDDLRQAADGILSRQDIEAKITNYLRDHTPPNVTLPRDAEKSAVKKKGKTNAGKKPVRKLRSSRRTRRGSRPGRAGR